MSSNMVVRCTCDLCQLSVEADVDDENDLPPGWYNLVFFIPKPDGRVHPTVEVNRDLCPVCLSAVLTFLEVPSIGKPTK